MLSCYTAHDPAVNRRKSYQPTISHYLPYYADCCFLGASKASADDLDTFQTITPRVCNGNIVATQPSQFATPAEARAAVDPTPARAPAVAVPAAAFRCFRRPCRSSLRQASNWAGPSGPAAFSRLRRTEHEQQDILHQIRR